MGAENFVGLHEDYNGKYQKKEEEKKKNEITSNLFSAFDSHFHRRGESDVPRNGRKSRRGVKD